MFKWSNDHSYVTRYLGSGVLNTVVGFAVIFFLMELGFSPFLANIGGYLVGFVLGFVVSKNFVFRSNGHFLGESMRYLMAFIICFTLNFLVLSMAITGLHLGAVFAQILAAGAYTLSMYVVLRCFVFSNNVNLHKYDNSLENTKENPLILKFMWFFLGVITLSAVVLINNYSPYIPEYDGLSYFQQVKIINDWQFNKTSNLNSSIGFINSWPLTNAISVIFVAIFRHTLNVNLLPTVINALYLFLFTIYVSKIRSTSYALIAILLLCAHTFFYRLFTTLTSEFSVGLWIFAFLLTLLSKHDRRLIYLSVLIILGVLLRTIDVVFILGATTAYLTLHYLLWKDKLFILATLRCVGLTLLLTAPFFLNHYIEAFNYVRESQTGISSVAWKTMEGVFGGLDVPLKYVEHLTLYNPLVVPVTIIIIIFGLYSKTLTNKSVTIIIGTSFAIIFPLLMAATLNIQTVFWVFAALIFIVCELGLNLLPAIISKLRSCSFIPIALSYLWLVIIAFFSLFYIRLSWGIETQYLKQLKSNSEIGFEISRVLNKIQGTKYITGNCRGVGAIDNNGLSWDNQNELIEGSIRDIYSKNKNTSDYLNFNNKVSFFISAHDNYFCPLMFGINDHVKELNILFAEKSSELGFRKVAEIARNNTNFDIWYKPAVQSHLQYANFDDSWISSSLSIDVGNKELCAGEMVSGKLYFSVNFPNPNIANYTPPFLISLHSKNSKDIISSVIVNNYGKAAVELDVQNIACGNYELSFDKIFSKKADPGELSAQYIKLDSALKFVSAK
jgi:putative flippase GtrA